MIYTAAAGTFNHAAVAGACWTCPAPTQSSQPSQP